VGGHVYIMANRRQGTLYVGVTADLARRVYEHQQGLMKGFTKRYGIKKLVYTEPFDRIEDAIAREKALKEWKRDWKVRLIEEHNPDWLDLSQKLNA